MQSDAPARPTLADVAAKAGVSASTASLAFSGSGPVSDATKERVLAAASALGYAGPDPRARSLRRGRSGIVGVVLEERVRAAFLDPVKIQMLDGITEGIAPLGAGLLLLTDTGEAGGNAVGIESAPVDAVVLVGCSPRLGALGRGAAPPRHPGRRDRGRRRRRRAADLHRQPRGDSPRGRVPARPRAHGCRARHAPVRRRPHARPADPRPRALRAPPTPRASGCSAPARCSPTRPDGPPRRARSRRASRPDARCSPTPVTRPTAIIAQSDLLAAGVI